MFNLTNQFNRLLSWIKNRQNHQNTLIEIQEQLGNAVHQVVVDQSPALAGSPNNEGTRTQSGGVFRQTNDESNITTSFNLSSDSSNLNNTNTNTSINNTGRSYNRILEYSPMQYQNSSSLLLGKYFFIFLRNKMSPYAILISLRVLY
jgi:hypothetical protein